MSDPHADLTLPARATADAASARSQASRTRSAIAAAEKRSRGRAARDARVLGVAGAARAPSAQTRASNGAHSVPSTPAERLGVDPHRRRQHRHVAGERLEHGEAEALALGGHEHGVGGVHATAARAPASTPPRVEQLDAGCAATRDGAVEALLRPRRVGREQQERPVGVAGRARRAPRRVASGRKRSVSTPHGSTSARRRRAGPESARRDAAETAAGRSIRGSTAASPAACAGGEVGAVHRQRPHPRRDRERGPRRQPEVGVHDVDGAPGRRRLRIEAPPQLARRRAASAPGPGGNSYSSTSSLAERPQRAHLVAHEAATLGMGAVGQHVRHARAPARSPDRSALE